MSPIQSVSVVTKTYKSGQVALHDINLTVAKGEIFALLALYGAGKTTSISIIRGFHPLLKRRFERLLGA
jgi:ABC-2 type transport system ATP-binding protein